MPIILSTKYPKNFVLSPPPQSKQYTNPTHHKTSVADFDSPHLNTKIVNFKTWKSLLLHIAFQPKLNPL